MVRRDDDDGNDPTLSRCASLAGASPVSVSVGAPSSRSPEPRETSEAEARRQEPRKGRQGRGPQHEVKLAASTDIQPGSRAAHFTAKATATSRRSEMIGGEPRGRERSTRPRRSTEHGRSVYTARVRATQLEEADGQSDSGAAEVRGDLRALVRKRKGRNLRAGEMNRWTSHVFYALGLHKLLGTIRYPGNARLPRPERPPVSRVREIRTHGLNGGLTHSRRKTEEG